MNAAQQRTHRTVTDELRERIEVLELCVERLSKNEAWLKSESDRHSHEIARLDAQLGNVSGYQNQFVNFQTWRQRARWILTGRYR